MFLNSLSFFLPQCGLLLSILFVLLWGVSHDKVQKGESFLSLSRPISFLAFCSLAGAFLLMLGQYFVNFVLFYGGVLSTSLIYQSKLVIFILAAFLVVLFYSFPFFSRLGFESVIFLLLIVFALDVLLSSNDFLVLYLSLELQSLCFYVLAASKRDSSLSSEGGLKYFSLGSLASAILLLGISLFYYSFGSLNFAEISSCLVVIPVADASLVNLAFLLVLCSFLFKLAAVPFHNWAADVYQATAYPVTAVFLTLPKVVIVVVLMRFLFDVSYGLYGTWSVMLYLVSIFSVFVGALFALRQWKVRRLLAYSSIMNVGFILAGFTSLSFSTMYAVFFYVLVYVFLNLSFIFLLQCMRLRRDGVFIDSLSDFSGLYTFHPLWAWAIALNLFSFAGIPPLAGFYSKFYLVLSLWGSGFYFLSFLLVLVSILSAVYYIYLVRVVFFERAVSRITFEMPYFLWLFSLVLVLVNVFFIFFLPFVLSFILFYFI